MVSLKFIIGLFVFILIIHGLAVINSWYWTYKWIDMPMHFLGGFWLGIIFLYFINPSLEIKNHKFLVMMILIVSFAVFVGVLWEFFEFLSDVFISSKVYLAAAQQGTGDTMSDLFFDLLGGLAVFVGYNRKKFKEKL